MESVIREINERANKKARQADETAGFERKTTDDNGKLDDFKEPILKAFQEMNIERDTTPPLEQDVEQNGKITVKSDSSVSSTVITESSGTSSDEQLSKAKVGTSTSCPLPVTEEAPIPTRFRSRFRMPKFHFPRTTFQHFRRSTPEHGQLVEECSSPVNTLERDQNPITVKKSPSINSDEIHRRRRRMDRLRIAWKGTKRSFSSSCNCLERRERSEDYRPSEEIKAGLDDGRLEFSSNLTSVSNENTEIGTRTDHG